MKQKIEDFKVLIKNDRRILVGIGLVFFALLLFVFTDSNQKKTRRLSPQVVANAETQGSKQGSDANKVFEELISAYGNDIGALKDEARKSQQERDRIFQKLDEQEKNFSGMLEGVVDELEHINKSVEELRNKQTSDNSGGDKDIDGSKGQQLGSTMDRVLWDTPDLPPAPEEPQRKRVKVITPGDSVPLELLTGVAAPVDGTPYPVVFRLTGPVTGPDGAALEVGEARLIAAAQGSEADGRVLFRLTNLSIRHKDGRRSVVPVDGWIVGEDGIRGMQGRLIDKLGRLIAATAGVSFMAALGQGLENRNRSVNFNNNGTQGVTVNNDDVNFATASAMVDSSNRLGQLLIDRYEKLIPVVEVLSGRNVVAIFSSTAEVEDIDEEGQYGDEGIYAYSLD